MQAMYDLVGDRIQHIFDAQVVDIGILDATTGKIRFPYAIEKGVRFPDQPLDVIGFRKRVLESQEPIVVNEDIGRVSREMGQGFAISGEQPKSCVFVPLVVGDRATGVISLQNIDREHAFSDADVRLLTTLAGSLSVALENARLFEETRQRNAELALINEVQRGLVENLDMQSMYDLVGDRIQQIFDAQIVDMGIIDPTDGLIHFPYSIERGERFPDQPMAIVGYRRHVIETREPLLIGVETPEIVARYGQPAAVQGEEPLSMVFVPLAIGERRDRCPIPPAPGP